MTSMLAQSRIEKFMMKKPQKEEKINPLLHSPEIEIIILKYSKD